MLAAPVRPGQRFRGPRLDLGPLPGHSSATDGAEAGLAGSGAAGDALAGEGPSLVFAGDHLRAALWSRPGGAGRLMVTFDHRKPEREGFGPLKPSETLRNAGIAQLSISTTRNDWFINPDTLALAGALARLAPDFTDVGMIGYSMGGYGALRFAAAIGAGHVVAISPQVSLHPAVVPFERRFRPEARDFDPVLGALAPHAMPSLKGVLVVDPFMPADRAHARAIRALFPGLTTAPLAFAGHPASQVMRDRGAQGVLIREAMSPFPSAAAITAAHRASRRLSPRYWQRLALCAGRRRPALAALARDRAAALERQGKRRGGA